MRDMEPLDHRAAVGQLADDLHWLEDHCRRQTDLAPHAGQLRLAAALARNVVGPYLDGQPPAPLHLAVVGGAGAGKSTVVNFVCGAAAADANPQAGYTRHPTAYLPPGAGVQWPAHAGFLGPLHRITDDKPASLDEDVYQVKRLPPPADGGPPTAGPLAEFVVWDCPDMTTWASAGYVSRLVEVAALADVVVYVASDERYNDEVPTQFLHLLVKAGKAVVVVLTKMREADAQPLAEHFRREVLGRLPKTAEGAIPPIPCLTFPYLTAAELADPAGGGAKYRVPLLNQVLALCGESAAARKRTAVNAARYLGTAGDGLLDVARKDLAELDAWKAAVMAGKAEFEERYRREFLAGEQFRRFDRTRDRLLELIELPGAGKAVTVVLWGLRAPYRLARDTIGKALTRPNTLNLPEQTVLSAALLAWLDGLRAEALKRAGTHPVWKQIAHGFDGGLSLQARDRFAQEFRGYELKETDELERAGRELTDGLERQPALLNTLRVGKVGADVTAVAVVLWATWVPSVYELLLLPLGVSVTQQGSELAVRAAVESARSRVRDRRLTLVNESLTGPVAEWLADWPATGGSSFERLQQVLRRVPLTIRKLEEAVEARAGDAAV